MRREIALEKVIDYLLLEGGADICAKCVYEKEAWKKNGDLNEDFCKHYRKQGNLACKSGMIKFYTKEK